jgi:hypothetical protein
MDIEADRHDTNLWRQMHAALNRLAAAFDQTPRRFETRSYTVQYANSLVRAAQTLQRRADGGYDERQVSMDLWQQMKEAIYRLAEALDQPPHRFETRAKLITYTLDVLWHAAWSFRRRADKREPVPIANPVGVGVGNDQIDAANSYACERCRASGVRLFRPYSRIYSEAVCAACLVAAGVPRLADRFEWWVPAVPNDDKWWGYHAVPEHLCEWWYALPESPTA